MATSSAANPRSASRRNVALAYAAIYLIWGSTYLAIKIAIETIPPFLMAGIRFAIAGSALYTWARFRGVPRPTRIHWASATVIGGLLLFGGNGALAWAEQTVPSGLAAVLIATVPLWMAAFLWVRGRERPTPGAALGLPVGFAGVALLVAPWEFVNGGGVDPTGAIVLMGASVSWAAGSLYSRRAPLPASPLLATAMEMLAGAGLLFVAGTAAGEWFRLDLGSVSAASALAVAYLVTFGSLIAFTAYIWLLMVSPPAKVSTYAYVNPIVAVILGATLAAEPLTARTLASVAVILGSVVLITTYRNRLPTREKALA